LMTISYFPYRAQQEKSNPLWKEELMLFYSDACPGE